MLNAGRQSVADGRASLGGAGGAVVSDYLPQTADSMMKTAAMMAQAAAMTYVVVE